MALTRLPLETARGREDGRCRVAKDRVNEVDFDPTLFYGGARGHGDGVDEDRGAGTLQPLHVLIGFPEPC
ncbi:hypothetical protein GOP47_0025861 [Adiantum capillus-veneris]|uniref:Uncharacterized protein n=1 Tax=Adiantum capillus-veneris TaxID=13818 RepID=A0A9D4Z3Y0_ADICA|nr:hypothetical protein GOP47_0025861 [Adiantum capillus-veneris]